MIKQVKDGHVAVITLALCAQTQTETQFNFDGISNEICLIINLRSAPCQSSSYLLYLAVSDVIASFRNFFSQSRQNTVK